jgi:hypothetical protein
MGYDLLDVSVSMGESWWFTRRRYQQVYFGVCRNCATVSTWGRCRYLHGHDAAINLNRRAHSVGWEQSSIGQVASCFS